MSLVIAAFAEYFVKFIILVVVAVLGVFCGDYIRKKKDSSKK